MSINCSIVVGSNIHYEIMKTDDVGSWTQNQRKKFDEIETKILTTLFCKVQRNVLSQAFTAHRRLHQVKSPVRQFKSPGEVATST